MRRFVAGIKLQGRINLKMVANRCKVVRGSISGIYPREQVICWGKNARNVFQIRKGNHEEGLTTKEQVSKMITSDRYGVKL